MNDKTKKQKQYRFVVMRCSSLENVNRAFGQFLGFANTKEEAVMLINNSFGEKTFRYGVALEYMYLYTPETDLLYALIPIE